VQSKRNIRIGWTQAAPLDYREGVLHAEYASFGNARRARTEAIGMPATRYPRQLPELFSARAPKSTANWLRGPEIFRSESLERVAGGSCYREFPDMALGQTLIFRVGVTRAENAAIQPTFRRERFLAASGCQANPCRSH
jgi:hypothetical protein